MREIDFLQSLTDRKITVALSQLSIKMIGQTVNFLVLILFRQEEIRK